MQPAKDVLAQNALKASYPAASLLVPRKLVVFSARVLVLVLVLVLVVVDGAVMGAVKVVPSVKLTVMVPFEPKPVP
jgi:hypothetical protein